MTEGKFGLRFAGSYHQQPIEHWTIDRILRFFTTSQVDELVDKDHTYLPDDTFVQLLDWYEDASELGA